MVHTCILSTQEAEAGRSWVQGQFGLHNVTWSQKQQKKIRRATELKLTQVNFSKAKYPFPVTRASFSTTWYEHLKKYLIAHISKWFWDFAELGNDDVPPCNHEETEARWAGWVETIFLHGDCSTWAGPVERVLHWGSAQPCRCRTGIWDSLVCRGSSMSTLWFILITCGMYFKCPLRKWKPRTEILYQKIAKHSEKILGKPISRDSNQAKRL
jgi:hypothetical protein